MQFLTTNKRYTNVLKWYYIWENKENYWNARRNTQLLYALASVTINTNFFRGL